MPDALSAISAMCPPSSRTVTRSASFSMDAARRPRWEVMRFARNPCHTILARRARRQSDRRAILLLRKRRRAAVNGRRRTLLEPPAERRGLGHHRQGPVVFPDRRPRRPPRDVPARRQTAPCCSAPAAGCPRSGWVKRHEEPYREVPTAKQLADAPAVPWMSNTALNTHRVVLIAFM